MDCLHPAARPQGGLSPTFDRLVQQEKTATAPLQLPERDYDQSGLSQAQIDSFARLDALLLQLAYSARAGGSTWEGGLDDATELVALQITEEVMGKILPGIVGDLKTGLECVNI